MKKIIELFIAILLVGGSLLVFLYCKGFRITYAPDLENSWDAISAFAAWFGVFTSILAILAAGIVAWRQNEISRKQTDIADKQNKIALFEKRFEIYDILSSCSASAQVIKMLNKNENVLQYLFFVFINNPMQHKNFNRDEARIYLTNCASKLQSASFFFSEEIVSYITAASVELLILANADAKVDGPKKYEEKKQNYFEAIKNIDKNEVLKSMKAEMKMI